MNDKYTEEAQDDYARARKIVDEAWRVAQDKNPGSGKYDPEVVGFAFGYIQGSLVTLICENRSLKEHSNA